MEFRQIQPPPALVGHVRFFWTMESAPGDQVPKMMGPLADGCPGLIFQHGGEGLFYDEQQKPLPPFFLYGQTVTRTRLFFSGRCKTVGVTLYPHTLKSVFGFNAAELTDSCMDLHLLSTSLPEQLLNAGSVHKQIELLSGYLLSLLKKHETRVDAVTHYALNRITASKGSIALKELQQHMRLTERSFERKFNQHVGVSPKLFAKICRFQASLQQLRNNRYAKLSDIAFDNGYADQSHFIRIFREFAGVSPFQFQKQAQEETGADFPVLLHG